MKIVEVFESIQGEGLLQGCWCTFVRLAGCNLSCPWCDEKEHKDKSKVKEVDVKELAQTIKTPLVVVTGGEPTLQAEELKKFLQSLPPTTVSVVIESNGTADPDIYKELCLLEARIVVSPKPQANFTLPPLNYIDCLKYVVDDAFWEWYHKDNIRDRLEREGSCADVYLQPCDSDDSEAVKKSVERILELCKDLQYPYVRAGIQMHKAYSKMLNKEVK